jgi:hypothetical protein
MWRSLRRYRRRGSIRATTWTAGEFDRGEVWPGVGWRPGRLGRRHAVRGPCATRMLIETDRQRLVYSLA